MFLFLGKGANAQVKKCYYCVTLLMSNVSCVHMSQMDLNSGRHLRHFANAILKGLKRAL